MPDPAISEKLAPSAAQLLQLHELLVDAGAADASTLDVLRGIDINASLAANGFDSLTQLAVFCHYEEVTLRLPSSAHISVCAILSDLQPNQEQPCHQ